MHAFGLQPPPSARFPGGGRVTSPPPSPYTGPVAWVPTPPHAATTRQNVATTSRTGDQKRIRELLVRTTPQQAGTAGLALWFRNPVSSTSCRDGCFLHHPAPRGIPQSCRQVRVGQAGSLNDVSKIGGGTGRGGEKEDCGQATSVAPSHDPIAPAATGEVASATGAAAQVTAAPHAVAMISRAICAAACVLRPAARVTNDVSRETRSNVSNALHNG